MTTSPNQLSFLPDDYLERKAQRRTNVVCALLFILVFVVMGATFVVTEREAREVDKRDAETLAQYTEAAKKIAQAREIEEKQKRMTRQAELAASLLEKVPRGNILADLTNLLPAGVSLIDFELTSVVRQPPAKAPTTKFEKQAAAAKKKTKEAEPEIRPKHYDVHMRITGVAYTDSQVAQYINRLGSAPRFRDVNLLLVEEHTLQGEKLRRFKIEMQLNPDATALPVTPDTRTAVVEIE